MAATKQVVFKLDNLEYGIDIMKVNVIEKYSDVVHVPNTPSYIEGIINLRGDVIPIYSLRKKFNMPQIANDENTKIIITRASDMLVGFTVDSVAEIITIDDNVIVPTPKLITGITRQYISNVAKVDERMIVLIDIDLILSEEEQITLEQVAVSVE